MRRFAVGDLLTRTTRRCPEKEAIVFGNVRFTYDELNKKVNKVANALTALGVKKNDKVAILSHNCSQYVIYLFAMAKIGAWATPVNFMLRGEELVYIINDSESVMFIVEDVLVDCVLEIKEEIPGVKFYCSISLAGKPSPDGWLDFDGLCSEKYSDAEPYAEINYDDVYNLLYTSGTEAAPKGVMNSHLNWYSTLLSAFSGFHIAEDDILALDIPLYHIAGIGFLFLFVAAGEKSIIHYTVDPKALLEDVPKEKITYLVYPPVLFVGLLQLPVPDLDEYLSKIFSTVKKCLSFGANMPEVVARRWMEKISPDAYWMNYYGQSELTPLGTMLQHKDILRSYEKAEYGEPIGKPHLSVEMRVVDDNDNDVPVGEVGEMVARSPSVMLGYYKNEEKTKSAFKNGWHHTGDLARIDEDGFYYFVDRKKDVVKTGGENVSTYEVEGVIFKQPKVADVAVIGLPDDYWGEIVTAVVVPKAGQTIKEKEIIEFCKETLAGYKVPKRVFVTTEIPKNPSGKILKKDLQKQYEGKGGAK
jgi:fatty-acyl-CoA synthase